MSTQTELYADAQIVETMEKTIVVFNDEVNTFDHVIESFVKVLKHTAEQAEQCAWIVHHRGKCKVKSGTYEDLEPLCTAILERGISAEIH